MLASREDLVRAFYRLVGSSEDDETWDTERFGKESVYELIQQGLWDAQEHMISAGAVDRWRKSHTIGPLTAAGYDPLYVQMPADFLRLASTERQSGILDNSGRPWGQLVHRGLAAASPGGVTYWVDGTTLIFSSSIPELHIDYHYRHPVLESDDPGADPILFPVSDRPLIVAFAAQAAAEEAWFTGDDSAVIRIERRVQRMKLRAARSARTTREPRKLRPRGVHGTHWIA